MIIKNEIPILEYDTSSPSVIAPNHDCTEIKLPEYGVMAFVGEELVSSYVASHKGKIVNTFICVSQVLNVYEIEKEGQKLALVQGPVGAPVATEVMDMMIACGCKTILATGSCGVLDENITNEFLIVEKALRGEGTSYHYQPASRYMELDGKMATALENFLSGKGVATKRVTTWSTDGLFRETQDMVTHRQEEGCQVVEMEAAALAACAKLRGANFGQFLFTGDSLANVEDWQERDFGWGSRGPAMELAVEAVLDLMKHR